jgi:hypothetical protein
VIARLSVALFASTMPAHGGAVVAVAEDAARLLGASVASSVVVSAPLESDQPAPKGDALALRVASLVAGRLGVRARAHPTTATLPAARAIAGHSGALVYVRTELVRGDLRATVDVYPPTANVWERVRNPIASPQSHAFSSAKVDAEVRTFLLPLLLEQSSVKRAHHDEVDVLAAACGDVDGDGGDEILIVSRTRVVLGRVVGAKFVAERSMPWAKLSAALPVPMRPPLAGAVVSRDAVYVGSTDRGGVELGPDLAPRAPLVGVPAAGGEKLVCLRPQPAAGAFDGAPIDCSPGRELGPKMALPAPRFDAFASANVVDAAGATNEVVAVREPSGRLRLKMGETTRAEEGVFGAQLAVGDLDQDGVPEVVTTADGSDDAIRVFSWGPLTADPSDRLRLSAPAGVRALAVCPPEEHGQPVLVAVVGEEVWLVRAGPGAAGAPPAGAVKGNAGP